MIVKVTAEEVKIIEKDKVNTGEKSVHICLFAFSDEYVGLVKKALFTNQSGDTYEMIISNNKCEIPTEMLETKGEVVFGVYGYQAEDDQLILRYSPTPIKFYVNEGSYKDDAQNSSTPTPSELEQLETIIAQIEDDIQDAQRSLLELAENINNVSGDVVDIQGDIVDIKDDITNIENSLVNIGEDIDAIEQQLQNYVTENQVQAMIDNTYTDVMEVEY